MVVNGILAAADPSYRPVYNQSKRLLTWPNGAQAQHFSAEEPERLRGPNHDAAWCDELAAWGGRGKEQGSRVEYTWDMMSFGLRLGEAPRCVITTTPKPIKLLRKLIKEPDAVVTRGSTYENRANVAADWLNKTLRKYEGTRLGRQELYAEILDDVPGALWTNAMFWDHRRPLGAVDLARVVVAVDPAVTNKDKSDENGIIVAGRGVDGHGYVIADRSARVSPMDAVRRAVIAYYEFQADCIVYEANQGGDMLLHLIATIDENVKVKDVHASRGKVTRAEPIAALYEQGRIHHCEHFEDLEEQCLTYAPGAPSPDRMDAVVWAFTELFLEASEADLETWDDPVVISRY